MPRKSRTYYMIAEKIDGKWTPQFGDYSKDVVTEELGYYRESGATAKTVTINGDTQADCDAAFVKLNEACK